MNLRNVSVLGLLVGTLGTLSVASCHAQATPPSSPLNPTQRPTQTSPASNPSAVVALDHWAYALVDHLQRYGIVIGYTRGPVQREHTRREFAPAIADIMKAMLAVPPSKPYQQPQDATSLARLVTEFRPELEASGINVLEAMARLRALGAPTAIGTPVPPFSDVAPGHWAYSAVEKLRQAGILIGDK